MTDPTDRHGTRLDDVEFEAEPHVDDCNCLVGIPDPLCEEYRLTLRGPSDVAP